MISSLFRITASHGHNCNHFLCYPDPTLLMGQRVVSNVVLGKYDLEVKRLVLFILISTLGLGMFSSAASAAAPAIPNVETSTFRSEGGYWGAKCTPLTWSGTRKFGTKTSYTCTFKDKSVSMVVMGYWKIDGFGKDQVYFIRTIAKSKSEYEWLRYAAVPVGIWNSREVKTTATDIENWLKKTVPQVSNGKKVTKVFASIKFTIIGGPGETRTVEIGSK